MRETYLDVILQNLLINAWEAAQTMEQPRITLRSWTRSQQYGLELRSIVRPVNYTRLNAVDYKDSRFIVSLSLPRYDALKDVA